MYPDEDRAVVVERSNMLVYLMISSLELKVEGSNPGHPETFIFVSECRGKRATSIFGFSIKIDLIGGLRDNCY